MNPLVLATRESGNVLRSFWRNRSGAFFTILLPVMFLVFFGVILWLAARDSRTPVFFQILGAFIFMGGVLTPFFGSAIGRTILDMWASYGHAMVRTWGLIATCLGVFIIYSVMSARPSR